MSSNPFPKSFRDYCNPLSRLIMVTAFPFFMSFAKGADVTYDLAAGNLAPIVTGTSGGVSASVFSIGVLDLSGGTNGVPRIQGTDAGGSSGTAITTNQYLSFSVTIPAGESVNLTGLSVAYDTNFTGANFSNSRVFSTIHGYANLTGDTIGVVGKTGSTATGAGVSTLNLAIPASNPGWGGNVQTGSFTSLTDTIVTFLLPWIDSSGSAADYAEISAVTLSFESAVPVAENSLGISEVVLPSGEPASISFMGGVGEPYSLMASEDLVGPPYRKHWSMIQNGTFGAGEVIAEDPDAGQFPKRFYVVSDSMLPKARIMPVGDSITEGAANFTVYKGPLYDKLTAAGYRFEYVGSKTSSYNSMANGTVTLHHEGYSGNNVTSIAQKLSANFPIYPADIVIIHAAHNLNVAEETLDAQGTAAIVTTVENGTRSMIQTCRTTNPKVRILLAKVITSGKLPKYTYIPAVNDRLGEIAAELNTDAQPVIIVDQAAGFDWTTDTISDMVHPNSSGGEKMAQKFFDALIPLLE